MPDLFLSQELEFNQTPIRTDGDMVSLTDLYAAAGDGDPSKDPKQWRRKEGKRFIDFVSNYLKVTVEHLFRITKGRNGSTFAHWQIGLAYAKYLDHGLHMHVNEIYARYRVGDPTLVDDVFDRQTVEQQQWTAKRLQGKVRRNELTQTLKDHGVVGSGYALCTDAIYDPLLGGTAKVVKEIRNLPAKVNLREHMTEDELYTIGFAEMLSKRAIETKDINGNKPCAKECNAVARRVASIL